MSETLTGRIKKTPNLILHQEILEPQFLYEAECLLPSYIQIEIVMLSEYVRMGWIGIEEAKELKKIIQQITSENLVADPQKNMSDISFAIEQKVLSLFPNPVPGWHMDRSRNDFQACAQLMFGRSKWLHLIKCLYECIQTIGVVAERYLMTPMPGFTHYQSAQIITPGFYLSAINEDLIQNLEKWIYVYDKINQCPLGSGAMAGVELDWDRENLAKRLGFRIPKANALSAVASREWTLLISSELSISSVLLSRFLTDLTYWGSSELAFIDLPDQLSGISSAMPQKKNFPVLERIRGKTSHLTAFHMDMLMAQRNTCFTNLVETSKEAGSHLLTIFRTAESIFRLLKMVMEHLNFNEERMITICKRDYFGGFTLANFLTMNFNIPYRKSQVIVGKYIANVSEKKLLPSECDALLLQQLIEDEGYSIQNLKPIIAKAFDVYENLYVKSSSGSTNPDKVLKLLQDQKDKVQNIHREIISRQQQLDEINLFIEQIFSEST